MPDTASDQFFTASMRALQDHFDSRRLADRVIELSRKREIGDKEKAMIESASNFFLATATPDGFPDCSYKGGRPGFVKVLGASEIAFPSYDGNGMFRSLGNIAANPRVGLLFVDWNKPTRLRLNGVATMHDDAEIMAKFPGAQVVVRVVVADVFPNCPRYVHQGDAISQYAPDLVTGEAAEAEWKKLPMFAEILPNKGW